VKKIWGFCRCAPISHSRSLTLPTEVKQIKLFIMKNAENKPLKKVHLDNFHIAGFGYWEGCEAFEHLKIGTKLELVRESDNAFDPYAIAIYYQEFKLGYVPRANNHDLSKYLDMGLENIHEARIQRISPDQNLEYQIEVILYIKNQKAI